MKRYSAQRWPATVRKKGLLGEDEVSILRFREWTF